tara:strand:- start:445 stop:1368 length:924 start_codon:yes stop_codon:yes gene_type:complete
MKSIMYHYVQDFNSKMQYFSYLNYNNFLKQILFFKKKFNFIDCKNIKSFSFNTDIKDKIFLTFDDGLLCHYDYVFKILKKYNLNAIFYIPTAPFSKEKILDVHKIHLILGAYGGFKSCQIMDKYLDKEMLDINLIEEYEQLTYKLQVNSDYVNKFKRTLNYYIKYEFREYFINKIFVYFFGNVEKDLLNKVYMSLDQIDEMYKAGMVIGSHGVNHKIMSRLSDSEFKKEIDDSFDLLEKYTDYKTFCYPYGGVNTFHSEIENYLNKKSVLFSVNVESRDISLDDLKTRKQALPRYDCNEFKYGQIST